MQWKQSRRNNLQRFNSIKQNHNYRCKKVKKDAYDYALFGGEDFELVFTTNKNKLKKLNIIKNNFTIVGKILPKKQGIYLLDKEKKKKLSYGYDQFKSQI